MRGFFIAYEDRIVYCCAPARETGAGNSERFVGERSRLPETSRRWQPVYWSKLRTSETRWGENSLGPGSARGEAGSPAAVFASRQSA